ncbi:MAG: DMT family transporter [Synechococcales cyanobacterium K44_A2020_017]|nr:DMT family transporter [Synechococcales cyanobacterium K32_A2020_035]MBF2094750.1 DMT family transporter [Synechococcales cyanobacterium K44_A2020_017]
MGQGLFGQGRRRILLPLVTSALFAGSFVAGKFTTLDMGPITTSFWRYAIALVFLSLLVRHYGRQSLRLARADVLPMALLGLFGVVGYHVLFFSSLRYTEVANSAIINAFSPVVTGSLAAIALRERLLLKNYLGCGLAVLGVLFLLTRGQISTLLKLTFNRGDGLMLAAVVCWAIYTLIIKKLSARYSGFTISYYAALFGVVQLLLLSAWEGGPWRAISPASLGSVLYMGIGASGTGYLLYNLSVGAIGPTRTATSVYSIVPIFVALLALLFFQQPITPVMLASMGLIGMGLRLTLATPQALPLDPPKE